MHKRKGQQEMVGFVLIVIIVVVALLIFVLWVAFKPNENLESKQAQNMLSVILEYTTNCSVSGPPRYESVRGLFRNCYDMDKTCVNLNERSCSYLNRTLESIMNDILKSENRISAVQLDFLEKDEEGKRVIYRFKKGNCTSSSVIGAQENFMVLDNNVAVKLSFCID